MGTETKIQFEDIQKANAQIKTTDVKGKKYAEVNQRVKAFRMIYPQGTIETALIKCENGMCIMRAEVMIKEENGMRVLGTGTAYEKENSSFINKTSYIENCETSAVGRALGMAGFGIDTSIASAEEVQNAIENQEKDKQEDELIDDVKKSILLKTCKKYKIDDDKFNSIIVEFGYKSINEIKLKDYAIIGNKICEVS